EAARTRRNRWGWRWRRRWPPALGRHPPATARREPPPDRHPRRRAGHRPAQADRGRVGVQEPWSPTPQHRIPPVLAWMDLEMTGLDPARHRIVEIASLITDDDLEVVAEGPDIV